MTTNIFSNRDLYEKVKPIFQLLADLNCWIAGGAIRDLCKEGLINTDIDVFFSNPTAVEQAHAKLHEVVGSHLDLENERVYKWNVPKIGKIDIVRIPFTNPQACIDRFDFTVCSAAVDHQGTFYCHRRFFQDLEAMALVVNQLPFPLSSMRRMQKYIQKGYTICQGGILEIARAIQKIDLEKEQVFYVD